ncbi:response regulator [Pseudomonas sp. S10E 269]|uniref:response regulator n=1 Tax=Pseudomonas sp. S10E 269 TaxID=2054917 RepID=UPI0012FD12F9|nr:response regulator [Pseudomonas sp. S10E 269]
MSLSTLRILVLEAQPLLRHAFVRSLRELGCQHVIEAADGNEALTALQQQGAVDIALCDICMEGMDGLSFLREAGQRQLAHAVIISSDLAPDLLQTIGQMVKLLGMQLLGELAKNARPPNLKRLLEHYVLPSLSGGLHPPPSATQK